jgi:hypothetical protein
MRSIKEIRRGLIMAQKRFSLFKYNIKFRMERGAFYDIGHDIEGLKKEKSLNILDLKSKKEFFLLDKYSDAALYGGLSETELEHHEEGFVRVKAKFIRERTGLQLPTNILFCGFQNIYLIKQEFDHYNGIRITMRPPKHPCKVGIHLKVSIANEHELFVGHIMDTNNPNPSEFQKYELPISLLHQDFVMSKILNP